MGKNILWKILGIKRKLTEKIDNELYDSLNKVYGAPKEEDRRNNINSLKKAIVKYEKENWNVQDYKTILEVVFDVRKF
jgi:hypothetical protein